MLPLSVAGQQRYQQERERCVPDSDGFSPSMSHACVLNLIQKGKAHTDDRPQVSWCDCGLNHSYSGAASGFLTAGSCLMGKGRMEVDPRNHRLVQVLPASGRALHPAQEDLTVFRDPQRKTHPIHPDDGPPAAG